MIDNLKGAQYFASLDLISGYHQLKIADDHKERTAFTTPCGFFHYVKMPFGLKNAVSDFQRTMEKALGPLLMKSCCCYLDDIIVFGSTKEELYENLAKVFEALKKANLILKPKKCKFLLENLDFLGFSISKEGVRCSDKHIKDVLDWPKPSNVKELQIFLGLCNYLRRFVPGFAHLASGLTKLLKGHTNRKCSKSESQSRSKPAEWVWGEEQDAAFAALKGKLTSPPCLQYPDFDKPFVLHTDGCGTGIGCALYQRNENGKLHPIGFGSRTLTQSERNYTTHKLEFLALKWAITSKFQYYLYNSAHPFEVYTDHNPLVYLTSTAKLDALGHRWVAELSNYNFSIHYKPGSADRDAD